MEPRIERGAAPDVHRIEDASVNWYLVEAAAGLTIVDAGIPRSWDSLQRKRRAAGAQAAAVHARAGAQPLPADRAGRAAARPPGAPGRPSLSPAV
jgi:hypothetical protein